MGTQASPDANRIPPHDHDAEQSVLGAMLESRDVIAGVVEIVERGDFYEPAHAEVFDAILALHARGDVPDAVTVAAELARRGTLEEIGGKLYIADLIGAYPIASNAPAYAREIAKKAALRLVISASNEITTAAYRGDGAAVQSGVDRLPALARPAPVRKSTIDGATFALDAPPDDPAVWGEGESIAWASGESLMIVGPTGVGKTTFAQQLTLARIGLQCTVLGFPVVPDDRRVLYVAADRPKQARRSFRRMVGEEQRDTLAERLVVWEGSLREDLAARPHALRELADDLGIGTIVVDSLKDVALDLGKDETGSRVNFAIQQTVAAGIELLVLHHQRKQQAGGSKPRKLEDVYGSTWLTAGAGSVLLLWGEPGDSVVELTHLKQPAGDIGPLRVVHDHKAGRSSLFESLDLLDLARSAGDGLTAAEAARALFETDSPDRNQKAKATRRLQELVRKGLLYEREGTKGGRGGGEPARWLLVERLRKDLTSDHGRDDGGVAPAPDAHHVEAITEDSETAGQSDHGSDDADDEQGRSRLPPSLEEGASEPDDPIVLLKEAFPGSEVVGEGEGEAPSRPRRVGSARTRARSLRVTAVDEVPR